MKERKIITKLSIVNCQLSILAALLLFSCAKTNYVPYMRTERIIDTVVRVEPDSSALRALFACDSLGQVYVREIAEYKGKEASQEVSFVGGELRIETKWRTQYIDRIREVHDTTTVVREVEIPITTNHIPQFFWWCFAIALLAIIYTIYRIVRRATSAFRFADYISD